MWASLILKGKQDELNIFELTFTFISIMYGFITLFAYRRPWLVQIIVKLSSNPTQLGADIVKLSPSSCSSWAVLVLIPAYLSDRPTNQPTDQNVNIN